MNFEKPDQQSVVGEFKEEKIIPREPKLRHLDTAFSLLRRPEKNESGEELHWLDLYKKVAPYKSAIELTNNVQKTVEEFIASKIPDLKKEIPVLKNLSDKAVSEALAKNWFQGVNEKIGGKRTEVLLTAMAHIVKRIEKMAYRKIFENASQADLEKLGLNETTRNLLVEVLDISIKANPLFVRFLAMSQLTPEPPEGVSEVAYFVPGKGKEYTPAVLFPHESQFLSKRLTALSRKSETWQNEPGGEIFKNYLEALGIFYKVTEPEKIHESQKQIENLYGKLVKSGFPVIITPQSEGYYKEPYYDPELKISIVSPEAKKEEKLFSGAKIALAESLEDLNAQRFKEKILSQEAKNVIVIGAYGVNLIFNAVAQEKPVILLYLNEQIRAYDSEFPDFLKSFVENSEEEFKNLSPSEKTAFMERMSRIDTMLHEFSHSVYPDNSEEAKRLNGRALTIIDEVKAEIVFRPLIPKIIEKGGLEGNKKQWAIATLGSSLQVLRDQPKGDPYYYAAAYSLNGLLEEGVVVFENGKARITDFEKFYEVQKARALELLSIYADKKMMEKKAMNWIKKRCSPNEKVAEIKIYLESLESEKKEK